jgi:phage FluMu protein Com
MLGRRKATQTSHQRNDYQVPADWLQIIEAIGGARVECYTGAARVEHDVGRSLEERAAMNKNLRCPSCGLAVQPMNASALWIKCPRCATRAFRTSWKAASTAPSQTGPDQPEPESGGS